MINMLVKPLIYLCLGVTVNRLMQQISPSSYTVDDYDDIPATTAVWSSPATNSQQQQKQHQRKSTLGDGCRHVFLDVGSNIGVHARMLLEPHLYPTTTNNKKKKKKFNSRDFFASQFGEEDSRINSEYCIFAFEPNPIHVPRHLKMERVYAAMGWRYHFVNGGVGDEDGTLTFYHIGKGNKELERGFTTVKSKCRRDCREEEVRVYRLSDWIDGEIHGRTIPPPSSISSIGIPPRVVMKMDIEMGEWLVFPDLLTSGVLCRSIDAVLGEFHLETHVDDYPVRFPHRGNWTLETYKDARALKEEMFGMIERNPNCGTELVVGDDESYGTDGMPWPEPPATVGVES